MKMNRLSTLLIVVFSFVVPRFYGQAVQTNLPLDTVQYKLARLAPGILTDQVVFTVDQCSTIMLDISTTDLGVTASITGPSGQIINSNTITSFGGTFDQVQGALTQDAAFIVPALTPGFHSLFAFPTLGPGIYTVTFQDGTGATQEVPIFAELRTDSPVGARLFATESPVIAGQPVVLSAAVFEGQSPSSTATVTVFIKPPTGPNATITLLDDGGVDDATSGDGLYSGEFTASSPGKYEALALIAGTTKNGVAYSRQSGTQFIVIPSHSQLTGAIQDSGIDDNGDSLLDRVTFDLGTQTVLSGNYRAFIFLRTATGKTFSDSSTGGLQAGSGSLQVNFPAADFLAVGEDGPYTIDHVNLVFLDPSDGAIPSGSLSSLGQTKAYQIANFQRDPLILTGVTSDQGVDDNGNGKFDSLIVTVQVNVLKTGFYSWNMLLKDKNLQQIGFSATSAFLNSGLNDLTFSFDGSQIGSSGSNGPFLLTNLLLFGPASIVVPDVGQTKPYLSQQFENGHSADITPPILSVSLSPTVLWPPNHALISINANIQVSDDTDPNPTVRLVSITSSEPNINNDIQAADFGTDDRQFLLRSERDGDGPGRTYTITYEAADASGNKTTVTTQVVVPHDQRNQ